MKNLETAAADAKKKLKAIKFHLKLEDQCGVNVAKKIGFEHLRYHLFGKASNYDSSLWGFIPNSCNFIASPYGFMMGYECNNCYAPSGVGFRKETCLFIYDALEDQGKKSCGKTEYNSCGFFNVENAQFLSLDPQSGRLGADKEYFEGGNALEKAFVMHYGRVPYKVGFFQTKKEREVFGEGFGAEYGLLFDDEYVNTLINKALNALLDLRINRCDECAVATELKIEPIYEDGSHGEEIVVTKDNVNDLTFDIWQFYVEDSPMPRKK